MLDDAQRQQLDRLWDELHFVSHDALTSVDAFAQLMEFATQDADPKVFEPLRKPINDRAAAFRQLLVDCEPKQLEALVDFAARAYRRPLTAEEIERLARVVRKSSQGRNSARRGVSLDARPRARRAGVLVSAREARGRRGARASFRLGTGQPAELLPLVVAARRRIAASGRGRPAARAGRARRPNAADAARREDAAAGDRVRLPVAAHLRLRAPRRKERAALSHVRRTCAARCPRNRFSFSPICFSTTARC